jgi:hypothetical protein
MARSLIVSAVATTLAIYYSYHLTFHFIVDLAKDGDYQFVFLIAGNVVADYLALYAIRYWLGIETSPSRALMVAPIIAAIIILSIYAIIDVVRFSIETQSFHPKYLVQGAKHWVNTLTTFGISSRTAIFLGALVVHSWLPLFAVGVLIARGLNSGRRAAIGIQWFLKEGNKHPLLAIAYVAASVAFLVAAGLQWLL